MEKSSSSHVCITVSGVLAVAVIASVMTLFVAKSVYPEHLCGEVAVHSQKISFPKEKPQWDDTERINIEEKGVTVARMVSMHRCYIMPMATEEVPASGRPLELVHQPLSPAVVEEMAGPDAVDFCQHHETFLLRDLVKAENIRRKREAYSADGGAAGGEHKAEASASASAEGSHEAAAPDAAPAAVPAGAAPSAAPADHKAEAAGPAAPTGGAAPKAGETAAAQPTAGKPGVGINAHRPSGLDLPLEQREPRCVDLILDCAKEGGVGQVQTCYTWMNGVIKMAQECISATQFKVHMTKPPGRMLKIAQQQWKICLQRRKDGLRC